MQNQPSKFAKMIERSLYRTLLPFILENNAWFKIMESLSKVTQVKFYSLKKQEPTNHKVMLCIRCKKQYTNIMSLILHLEIFHNDEIEVTKYELNQSQLTISYKINKENIILHSLNYDSNSNFSVFYSLKTRFKQTITSIFEKFTKKYEVRKKVYYHSNDIFKEIGYESQEEDSEDELGYVEREFEKMRISQFSDVSQSDKKFFILWNQFLHKQKKTYCIIDRFTMVKILSEFSIKCKEENISRVSLVMHLWTLWSAGKINSGDVSKLLNDYDNKKMVKK